MSKQSARNAHKRFRQGRISFQKLRAIVNNNNIAAMNAAVAAETLSETLEVEEHVHGEHCSH